ncbi:hypothetical protein HPB52_023669 [Rhipicephalus sanguineus]|uniref:Uncharacterized protein n=1 Tax=Rhipicephalus sanguineus TaxID=34632 RepID=A0A9D4PCS4_RHISA|nr:hypothetical protein HPB52_023669 [Rhipicephalus sanguineus]
MRICSEPGLRKQELAVSLADVDKLRLLYDKVQFRVSALTGLGVSPDQYNVVLNRVLMRCLPDDLAILYRQKSKEAAQDTSGIATPEERAHVEPPSAPTGHLPTASALAAESVPITAAYAAVVSIPSRTATFNSQLRKNGLGCAPLVAATVAAGKTTSRVFADVRAASSVVSATDDISLSSVNCSRRQPQLVQTQRQHEHAVSDIGPKRPERNERRSSPNRTSLDRVRVSKANLTAMETKFGWTIQGTTERERSSAFPRCDRGGPPSQRRPFFRGCALQTARPPKYPRVLQGGSGGGFDGARGPRRGFGVRPPFHGNNDTSSRDYDHTRYGDCRGDAVDGPHSLPDRTQQGRPQWRQRGRSVTPPTQPSAWKENWRTRTSQGARSSTDRRGCWESRSFYYGSGSSDSETDRGRRHPSGESGRETMMATSSSRARSRNVAAENSHRVAVRIAGESRELTRGAKAASRIASRARMECPREEDCCSKRPGDPQPLGARSHHDQTNEVSVKTSVRKVTDSVEPAAVVTSKATSLGAQAKGQTMDAARTPKCPRHTIKRPVQKVIHSGGKSARFNCLVIALAPWELQSRLLIENGGPVWRRASGI